MLVIKELLGRLHPLVVHLPIGFIIIGLLFQFYDRKKKEHIKIISLSFLWSGFAATLACISGYLLYTTEGYSYETVMFHLWFGVATALFSFVLYFRIHKISFLQFIQKVPVLVFSMLLLILISTTGHLGGNITHGEEYLIEPLPNSIKSLMGYAAENNEIILSEETLNDAILYEDIIQPILNRKCISCHGDKKAKGDLRLHTKDAILKGGENGEIIKPNSAETSSLYSRLILPIEDENHMPPKDKKQLTKEEVKLIEIWIKNENSFDKSVADLNLNKELFASFIVKKETSKYPIVTLDEISKTTVDSIKSHGIQINKISKTSNLVSVSCLNKPLFSDADFEILTPVNKHITELDLGGTLVTDQIIHKIVSLENLVILKLDHTTIEGKYVDQLKNLKHLKIINLTASKFNSDNINKLEKLAQVQAIYLYKTVINKEEIDIKNTKIYLEGVKLPRLKSDSIIY